MPRRAKVLKLPRELRARLDALLIENGFSGYEQLADWIAEQGHPIGKSTLHRYGAVLERRIEQTRLATQQAEALLAASPDDDGALAEATLRQVQADMFDLLLAAEQGDMKQVATAGRALAEVARASISLRRERRQVLKEAAQAANKVAVKAGLSTDTASAIRAAIEGAGRAP